MNKKQKMIAVFPTLLTLGNAACGFGSITFAAKVGPESGAGNELFIAAGLIFLAMLFDALDGSAARWANQTSEFGAQLDSLCDAISSGVAPAFLMLQFSRDYHPRFLWVIAVLFVVCAVLRLARFNVETDEEDSHDFFSGLPAPAAAGLVASFPIATRGIEKWQAKATEEWVINTLDHFVPLLQQGLPFITLAAAFLMVSRVRYVHVFNAFMRGRHSRKQFVQIVFTLAAIVMFHELALPLVLCYITLNPPLQAFIKGARNGRISFFDTPNVDENLTEEPSPSNEPLTEESSQQDEPPQQK